MQKIYRFPNAEDLQILQFGRFMDFQIQNVKKKMRILDSIKLLNYILKTIKTIKIIELYFELQSAILDINCENDHLRHYRPPPKETPSCAKRWSNAAAVQEEMESVCVVCGQRKEKE